jgi:hypothetical protein
LLDTPLSNTITSGACDDGLLTNPPCCPLVVSPYWNGLSTVASMFVADPLDVELKINDHDNGCGVIIVLTGCHALGPELFCMT